MSGSSAGPSSASEYTPAKALGLSRSTSSHGVSSSGRVMALSNDDAGRVTVAGWASRSGVLPKALASRRSSKRARSRNAIAGRLAVRYSSSTTSSSSHTGPGARVRNTSPTAPGACAPFGPAQSVAT